MDAIVYSCLPMMLQMQQFYFYRYSPEVKGRETLGPATGLTVKRADPNLMMNSEREGFPNNLEAAHEGLLHRLIARELLPTKPRDVRRQIIRFIQYVAKMLKRRERHIPLHPQYADQCRD